MTGSPRVGVKRYEIFAKARALWRTAKGYLGLALGCGAGLVVATRWIDCDSETLRPFCPDAQALNTVAQVVPATVVAMFVFALGAVFVIAQMVLPSRGARSIGELFSFWRIQAVIVGGLVLLVGALLISLGTPTSPRWRPELAAVLVAATAGYILVATVLISWIFVEQLSARRFKDRLIKRPRKWLVAGGPKPWESDELYVKLRVLRNWLRSVDDSRDLDVGLEGMRKLITDYAAEVRECAQKWKSPRLHRQPNDYKRMKSSTEKARVAFSTCGTEHAWSAAVPFPWSRGREPPWFADELGRALTRAVQLGLRANAIPRDLDRLLDLFEFGIDVFARPPDKAQPALTGEAYMLLKYLTEVALGVRQCDASQRDWFLDPALRMARLEKHLERVECISTTPLGPSLDLAWTALEGWLLAGDALIHAASASGDATTERAFLKRRRSQGVRATPPRGLVRVSGSQGFVEGGR